MIEIGTLIRFGNESNQRYRYPIHQEDYLIGRSGGCNLVLPNENILDCHCSIRSNDYEVRIHSIDLQHPVLLNDEPVLNEGKTLKENDKIFLCDDYVFTWEFSTHRRIFSRSLPMEQEQCVEEKKKERYSDPVAIKSRNTDDSLEEAECIAPQDSENQREDESTAVEELQSSLVAAPPEKTNINVSCNFDQSSVECGNKTKNLANTSSNVRKSNTMSPFKVSNTYISQSKLDENEVSHREEKKEFERSSKIIVENTLEDSILSHSSNHTLYHSTPKPVSCSKSIKNLRSSSSVVDTNFKTNQSDCVSSKAYDSGMTDQNDKRNVKSTPKVSSDVEQKKNDSAIKRNTNTPTKRSSTSIGENRRNTRGRTSILRKTFEEKSRESEIKVLTTPEKLKEDDTTKNTFSETDLESKITGSPSKFESISVSDENETCEGSFIDKYKMCNIVKTTPASKTTTVVAKCARNLSYISPPENNRSQEFMDSVCSPKRFSTSIRESINDNRTTMTPSILSYSKDAFDESQNTPLSSARKRRSTGFVPFVGTPSNEYRVPRKISTPFTKSILSRTSIDFEGNMEQSRDFRRSSERRSTPFKAPSAKSSIRDSMPCHPTIEEDASFEEQEAKSYDYESMNDSKFKFITRRRGRRFGESTFAAEDKIIEESELKSDCSEVISENSELNDEYTYEDENLDVDAISSCSFTEDFNALSPSDKVIITENAKSGLEIKSILTPLPKSVAAGEKSAKRVTFALPTSTECSINRENSELKDDESFAMITTSKVRIDEQNSIPEDVITDEELLSDKAESDNSCESPSLTQDDSLIDHSVDEKTNESLNVTGVEYLSNIQADSNDLSGVEQMKSPKSYSVELEPMLESRDVETNEKENDISKHSVINFECSTENQQLISNEPMHMKSSSSISKLSDLSGLIEDKSSRLAHEASTSKEAAQISVDDNLTNDITPRISCSSSIHFSGIGSLLKTPEKSYHSPIVAGTKCAPDLKTTNAVKKTERVIYKRKSNAETETIFERPSRLCKSLNIDDIKTCKVGTSAVKNVEIVEASVSTTISDDEVIHQKNINVSGSITEDDETPTVNKEITHISNESIHKEAYNRSDTSEKIAANEEISLSKEALLQESHETSTSTEKLDEISTANTILPSRDIPEIVISEATIIEENTNDEDVKSKDENSQEKESNEATYSTFSSIEAKFSNEVLNDDDYNLETSEFEDGETSDFEETSSSNVDAMNNSASPIITQIRRSASVRIKSVFCEKVPHNETQVISQANLDMECEKDAHETNISAEVSSAPPSSDISLSVRNDETEIKKGLNAPIKVILSELDSSKSPNSSFATDDVDVEFSKKSIDESGVSFSQSCDSCNADGPTDDADSLKRSITNNLSECSQVSDLSFTECVRATFLRTDEIHEEITDDVSKDTRTSITNLLNDSENTQNSQDLGIKIDVSNELLNDLHKELESNQSFNPSNDGNISSEDEVPEPILESLDVSKIENTPPIENEDVSRSQSVSTPIRTLSSVEVHDVFVTPNKTITEKECTSIRRCSRSLRIHRRTIQDVQDFPDLVKNIVHDCSISSNTSLCEKSTEDENKATPIELRNQQSIELSTKSDTEEIIDEPVNPTESIVVANAISPVEISPENFNSEIDTPVGTQNATNDVNSDISSKTELVQNIEVDSEESADLREISVDIPMISTAEENVAESNEIQQSVLPLPDQEIVSKPDTVPQKRNLRTRKCGSSTSVAQIPNPRMLTRNREKRESKNIRGRSTLRINMQENANEVHDDKENVCSSLEVTKKSKKKEPSAKQKIIVERPIVEKKIKKPRSLKNVENIALQAESQQIEVTSTKAKKKSNRSSDSDAHERSCSIVLPLLDPEVIKSPVKVDECGNISFIEEPHVPKRKRVTKVVENSKSTLACNAPKTRQTRKKHVTFEKAQRNLDEAQPVQEDVTQAPTCEIGLKMTTRSRQAKSKPNQTTTRKVGRPTKENSDLPSKVIQVGKKSILRKELTASVNSEVNVEEINSPERKPRSTKVTKRAIVNTEKTAVESSKRRRVQIVDADKHENSENNSKKQIQTRTKAKTTVAVDPVSVPKRSTRNKPLVDMVTDIDVESKKRIRGSDSMAKNDSKKPNKKAKISENTGTVQDAHSSKNVPLETKKAKPADKKSTRKISPETFNPTPRLTRSRKTLIMNEKPKNQNNVKTTSINKNPSIPEHSPLYGSPSNDQDSVNRKSCVKISKKSKNTEIAVAKRKVVTKSKKLSINKGRVSLTLKTTAKVSCQLPIISPSPARTSNTKRNTRQRAK